MPLTAQPQLENPMVADAADQIIDRIKHLPPAPTIATQLLDHFKDDDHNVDHVVELISQDPSLTVEVLKRCNSAFFSGGESVSDMFQAVTRIGFYEIYCMVMSMLALRTLALAEATGNKDTGVLWQHSVITAVAAGTLAWYSGDDEATAYTTGLLHDVGKLIIISAEPAAYEQIANETGLSGPLFLEMESSLLGVTHAEIGARLLARWSLPGNIVAAVLHHHASPAAAVSAERLTAILKVADTLAHQIAPYSPILPGPDLESMEIISLTVEKLSEVAHGMDREIKRMEGVLQMLNT